ncbi:hypothetical protein [Myxococcus sp. CA056]|uniref:hypothetical protein n=1 Tax=Myxococcus sp. CA056 TaxID=2741740 RepID=UPI00157A24D7|nr:hypothetical protein [Myxococcus sp. CA056]
MNDPRRAPLFSGPRTFPMGEGAAGRRGVLALALCLGLGSTAALASPDKAPFPKGTVLDEKLLKDWGRGSTLKRLACEGPFCLWHLIDDLGSCSSGYCALETLMLSDLQGEVLGATYRLEHAPANTVRFLDPEHVEVVTSSKNRLPYTFVDYGLAQKQVYRRVMKVSRDGARFIAVPSQEPKWTKSSARVVNAPVSPKPPKPRAVSDELLSRARALCPMGVRFNPLEYVCRDGTCLLLLTGFKPDPAPDAVPEDASLMSDGRLKGPFCVLVVKGKELHLVASEDWATSVLVEPTFYLFWGPMGVRGSTVELETFSRERPGYMAFASTAGAVVNGSHPYPVRFARSAEDALALAPTVQAYTQAHISWGLEGWKDAADLAFAWRLARVGGALSLHVEVHDDKVAPLGSGEGLHSDHLELTVWQVRSSGPRSEDFKLGVLLGAGGKVEARDWTRDAHPGLPSIQGAWRKRPRGYEVTLTLPLAELGVSEPLVAASFSLAVSDADAQGKQETVMGHDGMLRFWTEYPPSIVEYRRLDRRD